MVDEELSRAVLVYDHIGASSFPRSDRDAVRREFGDRAEALLDHLDALTVAINGVAVDWSKSSQDDAIDLVRMMLLRDFPELTQAAVQALLWDYPFGIK